MPPEEQFTQRRPEAALGAQPRPASGGQLVPATGIVTPTVDEAIALAATKRIVQQHLARGKLTQTGNLAGGAPRAKRPAVQGVENIKLNAAEQIVSAHQVSLGRRAFDTLAS